MPDRKNYTRGYKINSKDIDAMRIEFGYMNGNNRIPHPDANYERIDSNSDHDFLDHLQNILHFRVKLLLKKKTILLYKKLIMLLKLNLMEPMKPLIFS
ncbi:MAG: hypothetical protein J6581_06945 [Apibacter sp.]|nr:hypothetical protein [Apibacter sp.]